MCAPQAIARSLTVKSAGPAEGGAITFENTPAAGSSVQKWTLQPKAADATADGYASLVLSSDTSAAAGADDLTKQIVIRTSEANLPAVDVNGDVSLKSVGMELSEGISMGKHDLLQERWGALPALGCWRGCSS